MFIILYIYFPTMDNTFTFPTLFAELPAEKKNVYTAEKMRPFEDTPTLCVKAAMGIGKTNELIEYIIRKNFSRIIIISFRLTFTAEVLRRFPNIVSYKNIKRNTGDDLVVDDDSIQQNIVGDIKLSEFPRIVIQTESLHRICLDTDISTDTLVILDESESILNQFSSGLFRYITDAVDIFKQLMKSAANLIAMDANMGDRTYRILDFFRPDSIFYHRNKFCRYSDYTCHILTAQKKLQDHLFSSLHAGKKVVLATSSKNFAKNLIEKLINDRVLTKDQIIFISSEMQQAKKKKTIADLEDGLQEDKNRILIYTPAMTAGVSIEREFYDILYCYFINCSCDGLTCDQMMGRIRNIKEKQYYVSIIQIPLKDLKNKDTRVQQYDPIKSNIIKLAAMEDDDPAKDKLIEELKGIKGVFPELWLENKLIKDNYRAHFKHEFVKVLKRRGCKILMVAPAKQTKKQNNYAEWYEDSD